MTKVNAEPTPQQKAVTMIKDNKLISGLIIAVVLLAITVCVIVYATHEE